MLKKKLKVLVVDDALLMRSVLTDILNSDPDIEVIGNASDGKLALKKIEQLKPDVVTLDVEMPVMDGVSCLKELMKTHPTPAVMVSSITYEGGFKTIQALDAGAFDYVQKPKAQASSSLTKVGEEIIQKVKQAHQSGYINKFKKNLLKGPIQSQNGSSINISAPSSKLSNLLQSKNYIVAIGISTGGPPCVQKIFEVLPADSPPVLVVQHMPEHFTKAMAERINKVSPMTVKEAEEGELIRKGFGYIAPGHSHIGVKKDGSKLLITLSKGELVSGHRPSADALFESVSKICPNKAIGVIMTGMGRDGAANLKKMRDSGCYTIAQDKESCVVFGMPKSAIELDAVDEILSLEGILLRLKRCSEAVKV